MCVYRRGRARDVKLSTALYTRVGAANVSVYKPRGPGEIGLHESFTVRFVNRGAQYCCCCRMCFSFLFYLDSIDSMNYAFMRVLTYCLLCQVLYCVCDSMQ